MIWMVIYSFKSYPESYKSIVDLIFSPFTLINYTDTLDSDAFLIYFANSVFVAAIVTAGNLVFCLFAAYALVRKDFFGKALIYTTIAGVMIIPPHVIMIPLYRLMVNFNWINSYYALIFPWLVTPFGIYLIRQYLISLPPDIEDAARIELDHAGSRAVLRVLDREAGLAGAARALGIGPIDPHRVAVHAEPAVRASRVVDRDHAQAAAAAAREWIELAGRVPADQRDAAGRAHLAGERHRAAGGGCG